ncbi:MAG: Uma2 family endonuclease [Bacteroidota bacterium]
MRTTFGFILVVLTTTACTSTKHQLVPRYGFDFQPGERLVIAQFQSRSTVSNYATEQMLSAFQQCPDVEIVTPDHDGEVYTMAGGSPKHGVIAGNVIGLLQSKLKKGCRIGSSDLKFYIESIDRSLYPDASVICQPYRVSGHDRNALTNPILLVEVLSEGTANYDRGAKFHYYSELPSLRECVLVEQDVWKVKTRYRNSTDDEWRMNWFEGKDTSVIFHSINATISLAEIHQGIEGL